ncbi:hypothetical protein RUND412_010808 [Rhizina undulata]
MDANKGIFRRGLLTKFEVFYGEQYTSYDLFDPIDPGSCGRPNDHTTLHLAENSRRYSTSLNTSASLGERVHKVWKAVVPHSNHHELDLKFCQYYNTMNGIRWLLDGFPHQWSAQLKKLSTSIPTLFSGHLFGNRIVEISESGVFVEAQVEPTVTLSGESTQTIFQKRINLSIKERFLNIKFGRILSSAVVAARNHPSTFFQLDPRNKLLASFETAYKNYVRDPEVLLLTTDRANGKVSWADSISFFDKENGRNSRANTGMFISFMRH